MAGTMFETVFSAMGEGVVIQDGNAEIIAVNPAAERMLGIAAADLIGRTADVVASAVKLIHEDGSECPRDHYPAAVTARTGQPQHDEVRGIYRPDGTLVWLAVSTRPLRADGAGTAYPVAAIFRDITEHKRTEEALYFISQRGWRRRAENFFESLAQYLGKALGVDYVVIARTDQKNEEGETVALYAKGEIAPNIRYALKGTPCENVMGQEFCFYSRGIRQTFPRDALLAEMSAESYAGIPLWDSNAQPIGLIAVLDCKPLGDEALVSRILQFVSPRAADVLEHERSDRDLLEREREFRTLTESMPDNLIRFDRQCRVRYINPAIRTSLAPEVRPVLGKSYAEAFPDIAPAPEHQRQLERLMETGESGSLEIRLPNPQGEMRIHHVRYVAERDERGEIVGALSIGRDITEHKFAEQRERFRSHILEMLSGGGSLPDILEGIVRGVEQLGSGMICSILLREGDRLRHGIAPSLPDFSRAACEGIEIGIGIGSCGTAAASGQRVIVEDIRTHPYWAPFKELAAKAGLGSCWSQPVLSSSGQVLGTFAIYHHEVHTPTASDISIIEQAAHLASIAIERKLGEQQLKQALEFSEGIINAIPDILFEMDRNGTYLNVWTQNPELLAAHKQALLGKNVHEVLSPEAAAAAMDAIREADENGTAVGKDLCIDLPQGRFWFSHSLAKKPGNTSFDATFMVLARDITERKQAEALLVQREREFRSLSENLPDNIARYNREGVTVYVNSELERTLGGQAAAMIGTTPREFHSDGSFDDYAQLLDSVLASGEAGELEKTLPGPNGRVCTHQIRMVPERDEDGALVGVVAIGRDITERKRAELAQQAHARSLECLDWINKAIQGTTDLDQMMRDVLDIVLASFQCDRTFLIYPCDPDAGEWQVPMERTRPEYPGALARGIKTMPMDSDSAKIMRITRDASGPVMFGPGAEYPLPPNSSKSFGFKSEILMAVHPKLGKPWIFGIHQCAHAKVWTENEVDLFQKIGWRLSDALTSLLMYRDLRASEQQFRTLAENYPDILIRYDREGRRTYVNPAMEQMFAVTEKQTIGLSTLEANPLCLPETYSHALQHTLATGERSEFEMELPLSSGEVRTGFIYIVAERAMDGSISGAITIGRDITRLKQTEQQLRELAAHLQTVREEEKARLARELHDDLGQILFLLKMRVSYVHDSATDTGPWREHLQDALLLTERAMGTARNIVSALRPPALDFGIAAALKWLAENFVSNMHISCGVHVAEDESRIDDSKALALFRIVQEALNNVAKHAQADRVEISLFKDATDYVLTVRDNGIGFDKDKKKIGSFGLVGMQERALMHGGSVAIDSRPGGGTEISVRIPEGMKRE